MERDISRVDERFRLFPDPHTVFSPLQPWLSDRFNALLSIHLPAVDPGLSGWLHVVSPIEPMDGCLGGQGSSSNPFVGPNWIAFRIDEQGRYVFLGEREYFLIDAPLVESHPVRARREREERIGLATFYEQQHAQFAATRRRWDKYGLLVWPDPDNPERSRRERDAEKWPDLGDDVLGAADEGEPLMNQLGGTVGFGNWAGAPEPPSAFVLDAEDDDNVFPRWRDGSPFRFIADVPGYPWREQAADGIMVFLDPETRTVLTTFDWT